MFKPTEIIFAVTDSCNLHCPHCFVGRNTRKLSIPQAKAFIESAKGSSIEKIGFSGGEPFLYKEFLLEITKFTVEQDLLFDQLMTNGDWWKTEEELSQTLQELYDAGYDGKIGLSWDSFHGQTSQRMHTFIKSVQTIFGEDSLVIQSVKNKNNNLSFPQDITPPLVYELPQTFSSENSEGWKAWKWFKDDYCEGPGQILYVHPDGNIAPCCGFANENSALYIGTIEDSFETVMEKAEKNKMIEICYETGLGNYRKELKQELKNQGKKLPGKTKDICTFCDFVCKLK